MTIPENRLSPHRLFAAPLVIGAMLLAAGCAGDEPSPGTGDGEADTETAEENGTDDAEDDEAEQGSTDGAMTLAEVQENDSADSCWAVIDQTVYDLTDWIDEHPGGSARIEELCGTDATEQFTQQHGGQEQPEDQLTEFEVGPLED